MAPLDRLRHTLHTLRERNDLFLLLAVAALMTGGWAFAELADWVGDGDARTADAAILLFFRNASDLADPIGGAAVEEAMRDLTAMGSVFVTTLLSVTAVSYFLLDQRPRAALLLASIIVLGVGVVFALKFGIHRPRPDLVPHAMNALSPSFPSGHAATATVVYLTIGSLAARSMPRRRVKVFVLGVAVFLTIGVGISRVYLGVHWPTDVLAGWTIGSVWALGGWLVERGFQRRGWVERNRVGDDVEPKPERRAGAVD